MDERATASTNESAPRRLYVSVAVRAQTIKVSWGLESTEGERVSLTRTYVPPHGGTEFVDDLTAVVESLIGGDPLDALRALIVFPQIPR